MNARKRFFINGLLLTAVALAIRSVGIAFNSFVTRMIGAEGIGLFTLIGTVYAFAVTFASAGISLTVTRLVSSAIGEEKERDVGGILSSSVRYILIFGITASLVLFFGAEYFGVGILGEERTVMPLRILSLSLVPISLSSVFSGYFVGVKRVTRNAVAQVLCQGFKIGVTLLLVFKFSDGTSATGVILLCVGTVLTEISVFLILLFEFLLDRRRHFSKGVGGVGHFVAVSHTALPLAVSAYVRSALLTLEHALIPRCLRKRGDTQGEALASYGILHGMALPMLIYPMAPLSSFAGLLVPEFSESLARGDEKRMIRLATESLNKTLIYAIFISFCLALFSEELGFIVYGSFDAGRYVLFMCPIIPVMYLDHVTDAILKGIGEQVYSMWVNISDSLLSVGLVWILIPRLGIMGYAVVIVIMEGYNFLLSACRLRRRVKFKIHPFRSVILPISASLLSVYLSHSLFRISGSTTYPVWIFLRIIFALCVFAAIYLPLSVATGHRREARITKCKQ